MHGYLDLLRVVSVVEGVVKEGEALGSRESLTLPVSLDEMQLQALWFAGQMGREFTTADGKEVRIVQFGYWNHAAGPDFLHASVEIDGVLEFGAIELDHEARDWDRHGHAVSEAFNGVVLHVVFAAESGVYFTRNQEHREIPRVMVPVEVVREALGMPLVEVAVAHPGRCFRPLAAMEDVHVDALMQQAARHRVGIKALRRSRVVDAVGRDEWLWQALAETLGYRPNQWAMKMLAQRFPIGGFAGQGAGVWSFQRSEEMEAVIFGAAGFLSAELHDRATDGESREYLRGLWEFWWRVRGDFEPVPGRRIPWKFSGVRPVNHPQRRLACLARVAWRWADFVKACQTVEGMRSFFQELSHPYWDYHYTLSSKRSGTRLALLGEDRIQDFQVNHGFLARLAAGDEAAWASYQKMPASALSEKVDKAALRLFGETPRRKQYLRRAWQHQALLQIYQDFCLADVSDCARCPFPEQLAQWRV